MTTEEDAISRQAVLDVFKRVMFMGDAISEIEKLPSVTPKPKMGHWIQLDCQRGKFECSECHTQGYVDTCMYEPKWKYCPNCGAKMVEPQESEDNS